MYSVTWDNMTIPLRCGLAALEYAADQIGSLDKILMNIAQKDDLVNTMNALYMGMALNECEYRHIEPDMIMIQTVGAAWMQPVEAAAYPLTFIQNRDAVLSCLNDGMRLEYHGKNAKKKDKYTIAVQERMRKKTGAKQDHISVRMLYSRALQAGLTYTQARILTPSFIGQMARRHDEYMMEINPLSHLGKSNEQMKPQQRRRR